MCCYPADQVYMDKEEDIQEYVMNDVGNIYDGDFNNITSFSWNFGQVGSNLEMFLLIRHKKIPPTVLMPMYCLT